MNGPDDIRDEELSRRYRALPPELPHADTDAAIQAAARQAIAAGKHKPRVTMFYSGLAMAASVVLVVALMLPSWRSGELQERVAVDVASAPAALPPDAPADTAPADTAPSDTAPANTVLAEQAVAVAGSPVAPTLRKKTDVQAVQQAQGAQPAAPLQEAVVADASEQDAELAGAMPTVAAAPPASMPVPAAAPAPVDRFMEAERRETVAKEAVTKKEMTDSLKARMADRTRAKNVASQQARAAATEAATVSAVPTVAPATDSLDALLLAGRHAEALTLLQTGDRAADPALDSRRDLLRQLLAGADKALQCRPQAGPASAQALCRLLQRYQASHVVPADQLVLLRQALQAEGQDARPWLQVVARLP